MVPNMSAFYRAVSYWHPLWYCFSTYCTWQ